MNRMLLVGLMGVFGCYEEKPEPVEPSTGPADVLRVEIAPQPVACDGEGQWACWNATDLETGAEMRLPCGVDGLEERWGVTITASIEATGVDDSPVDGCGEHYDLVELESEISVAEGTAFSISGLWSMSIDQHAGGWRVLGQEIDCASASLCGELEQAATDVQATTDLDFEHVPAGLPRLTAVRSSSTVGAFHVQLDPDPAVCSGEGQWACRTGTDLATGQPWRFTCGVEGLPDASWGVGYELTLEYIGTDDPALDGCGDRYRAVTVIDQYRLPEGDAFVLPGVWSGLIDQTASDRYQVLGTEVICDPTLCDVIAPGDWVQLVDLELEYGAAGAPPVITAVIPE